MCRNFLPFKTKPNNIPFCEKWQPTPVFLPRKIPYSPHGHERVRHDLATEREHTYSAAAAAAKSLQSCPTLCDPIDGSPTGSPVPGILQARTLEWVAISFFNAWKWKVKVKSLMYVWFFAIPWTAAHQAPPSMGFSRQEYWSGVPLPSLLGRNQSCSIWVKHKYIFIRFLLSFSGEVHLTFFPKFYNYLRAC